jgi:hypothetical protein
MPPKHKIVQGPSVVDVCYYLGDTVGIAYFVRADLTGASIAYNVKDAANLSGPAIVSLSAGSGITITPNNAPPNETGTWSRIDVVPSKANRQTSLTEQVAGKQLVYDIETLMAGETRTWFAGSFEIVSDRTRIL